MVLAGLPELLTIADVAALLRCHRRTVGYLVRDGKLTAVRMGHRTVRFLPSDVRDYLDACREGPAA